MKKKVISGLAIAGWIVAGAMRDNPLILVIGLLLAIGWAAVVLDDICL